jgi:hypothetical protein
VGRVGGGSGTQDGWATGEGEVGGKARRGHGVLIKESPSDGRGSRTMVGGDTKAGILHWGGSTLRKRNNQQTGERHERFPGQASHARPGYGAFRSAPAGKAASCSRHASAAVPTCTGRLTSNGRT